MILYKYTLLAVYMPLTVLAAMVFLLKALLPIPFPYLLILGSGVISAAAASFYSDVMKDARPNRVVSVIRSNLIVIGISYVLSSLFRWDLSWLRRLLPGIANSGASLGALYMWISVTASKQLFGARMRFEDYTSQYQGDRLHKALFDDSDLLQFIDAEINRTKRNYLMQLMVIGLITMVSVLYNTNLPLSFYALLIIILASWICIFGFLGIIRREHYCAAEGMSLSAVDRTRQMLEIVGFTVFSVIAAILLASDKNIVPLSLIIIVFKWLGKIFQWLLGLIFWLFGLFLWLLGHLTKGVIETESETTELGVIPSFPAMEKGDPWPVWKWLQYGAIILAVAGFIWFMISPLLNRNKDVKGKLSFYRTLIHIIAQWFRGALNGLVSFLRALTGGGTLRKLRKPNNEDIRRTAGTILNAYSKAQKRDLRRSATLFARLIIWGAEVHHVIWKPAYAPGEYCGILASAADEAQQNEWILRCGELFEKALYSGESLSGIEQKEFKDLVEEITGE